MPRIPVLFAVGLLVVGLAPPGPVDPGAAAATPGEHPAIAGVYPNHVPDGDVGEYVLIDVPPGADLSAYDLGDGEATVDLPATDADGRVALTAAPARVRNLTDATVVGVALPGLANGGERLRLTRANRSVATLVYRDAPEAEVMVDGEWHHLAATDRPVVAGPTRVQAFVLPDAAGRPVAALANATDRLWIGAYTFTSARVREALRSAHRRGVDVRVLAEPSPVGGLPARQATVLDELADAGVDVRVFAGPYDPYAYHHAKYAVVDDRALVLTENWKPSGTGGHGNRGWGVRIGGRPASAVAETFRADWTARGTIPWERYRTGRRFEPATTPSANASYPERFDPVADRATATVLVAPDNARSGVTARLRNATDSVVVLAPSLERDSAFLAALVAAARRGVEVRVLLSGAWYAIEDNRQVVEALSARAEREDLPLRAKVAAARGRFGAIHAKGVVVDETVIVGSMNFNGHSAIENRELVVALESERIADYYRRVVRADWSSGRTRLPGGMAAALAAGLALALLAATRIVFDGRDATGEDDDDAVGWEF